MKHVTGSGSRGKGKRKFAPQGSWREGYQEEGADWLAVFQPQHNVPFHMASQGTLATGPGKIQAQTLVEKAQELWGTDGAFHIEVINGIFHNLKKSK